jgi:hypothetical protein
LASKVIVQSRFREAGVWATRKTHDAVDHALDEGQKKADTGIEKINASQGYQLPASTEKEGTGYHSGLIKYPEFYGQFFEFGFYSVPPMPFMRPAHRVMRKVFKTDMGNLFRGFRGVR